MRSVTINNGWNNERCYVEFERSDFSTKSYRVFDLHTLERIAKVGRRSHRFRTVVKYTEDWGLSPTVTIIRSNLPTP